MNQEMVLLQPIYLSDVCVCECESVVEECACVLTRTGCKGKLCRICEEYLWILVQLLDLLLLVLLLDLLLLVLLLDLWRAVMASMA